MAGITLLIFSVFVVYVVQLLVGFRNAIRATNNRPGRRYFFSTMSLLGNILPRWKWISLGRNYAFVDKYEPFAECGYDIETTISVWPKYRINIFVADPAVNKEITLSRQRFPKPLEAYTILSFFGPNIVVSEGDEWKKYRKISAPAFSDRNNKMVWDETMKIMDNLFEEVWGDRDEIVIDHAVELTLPIALFVIGSAGFGRRISWKDEESVSAGHKMTFKQALHIATADFVPKLFLPEWMLGWRESWRRCRDGFDELRLYMKEMIHERLASNMSERHDLFSSLLQANGNRINEVELTEDEIIGNIYIFLVAGHETTAHTICFTLALLALYQEEQDKLHEHITSIAKDRTPAYEEMPQLSLVLATIYETLRLFPPVTTIPKAAGEDLSLSTTNATGDRITIPVPKGTEITIHTGGLHFNPRYWEEPHAFKPERFLKDWPRDAFLPFSGGARACIGRKFSETEGVAILVKLVSRYKISIKSEPEFAAETFEQKKERVLRTTQNITVTPIRVPLIFTRRE